jgi:hypothetical protein
LKADSRQTIAKATLIDISSAGGYGSGMTTALFPAALYYAPLS